MTDPFRDGAFPTTKRYREWKRGHPNCSCEFNDYAGCLFADKDCAMHGELGTEVIQKTLDALKATDVQVGGDHYVKWPIQPIEFIVKNNIPFREANAIKYIVRHREKGTGRQDLLKARHYIDMILETEYPE